MGFLALKTKIAGIRSESHGQNANHWNATDWCVRGSSWWHFGIGLLFRDQNIHLYKVSGWSYHPSWTSHSSSCIGQIQIQYNCSQIFIVKLIFLFYVDTILDLGIAKDGILWEVAHLRLMEWMFYVSSHLRILDKKSTHISRWNRPTPGNIHVHSQ